MEMYPEVGAELPDIAALVGAWVEAFDLGALVWQSSGWRLRQERLPDPKAWELFI